MVKVVLDILAQNAHKILHKLNHSIMNAKFFGSFLFQILRKVSNDYLLQSMGNLFSQLNANIKDNNENWFVFEFMESQALFLIARLSNNANSIPYLAKLI